LISRLPSVLYSSTMKLDLPPGQSRYFQDRCQRLGVVNAAVFWVPVPLNRAMIWFAPDAGPGEAPPGGAGGGR
jgi:hypothetical protein